MLLRSTLRVVSGSKSDLVSTLKTKQKAKIHTKLINIPTVYKSF